MYCVTDFTQWESSVTTLRQNKNTTFPVEQTGTLAYY